MAVEVFKLFGSIFVDSNEADKSLSKTEKHAGSVASTLGKGVKTAAKFGAAMVGGASAAAGGMLKMATNSASTADNIDKMSQKIGVSRQAYQELDFICSQTGTSVDKLKGGMKNLRNAMANDKNAEVFNNLGVAVTDASGKMRNSEDVMWDTMSALQGVTDENEKAALAQQLFGKTGQELMPLLNSQSGSIADMKNKAHELGLVMSDELIDSGVGLNDSLDQTKRAFSAIITTLGAEFMPIVKSVSDHLQSALPYIQQAVSNLAPIIGSFLDKILPQLFELGETLFPIIKDAFEEFWPVLEELASNLLPIIISLFQQLGPIFGEFISSILPLLLDFIRQIAPAVSQFAQTVLPLIAQLFQILLPIIERLFESILPIAADIISKILPIISEIVSVVFPVIIDFLGKILPTISKIVESILPVIQTVLEAVSPLLEMLANTILPIISTVLDVLSPVLELLAGLLSGVLGEAIENITTLLQPLTDILNGIITFIKNVFQGNWEEAWNGIVEAFKGILNLLPAAIEAVINGIIWIINQMIGGINWVIQIFGWEIGTIPDVHLPRFRAGIDYVPNDKYLAYLDAGEAVLTASEAEEYRKAKQENGTGSPFATEPKQKTINQTFNVTVNVEKVNDRFDINELASILSEKLAEEVRRTEGVYA